MIKALMLGKYVYLITGITYVKYSILHFIRQNCVYHLKMVFVGKLFLVHEFTLALKHTL